jgi:hypothetical protein
MAGIVLLRGTADERFQDTILAAAAYVGRMHLVVVATLSTTGERLVVHLEQQFACQDDVRMTPAAT